MSGASLPGRRASDRYEYAGKEEFASVFELERVDLQRLAMLLTANEEAAKRCLILAFRECIANGSVFREWVLHWARRTIIRNAISLVLDSEGQPFVNMDHDKDNGFIACFPDDSFSAIQEYESILDLPEFDRLVFIICVLERYSTHDCALLLGRPPRNIYEARQRIGNQVGQIDERSKSSQRFAIR